MAAAGPEIVLLHGFTQTSASWRPVTDRLALGYSVAAIDLAGHGSASDLRLDLAADAARVAGSTTDDRPLLVGYSMGGRTALRLALDHPGAVRGLVLLGATAGIDDPDERAARRRADEELAARIEREGVAAFLPGWLAQPLFADLRPEPDDLAARLANSPEGLAASLRLAGTGTMDPPWWDELGDLTVPTLVVWGERDAKFAALGERLAAAIGAGADTAVVDGAGHAAHLEKPAAFARLIAGQLDRTSQR